jgi:competence protein ComEC
LTLFSLAIFIFYFAEFRFFKMVSQPATKGLAAFFAFMMLGLLNAHLHQSRENPQWTTADLQEISQYTAVVNSKAVRTSKTFKYEVVIEKVKLGSDWYEFPYRALMYCISETSPDFQYGDRLMLNGHPSYIEGQTNPHAFDYSNYMKLHGIYLQGFIRENDFLLMTPRDNFSVKKYSIQVGDYLEAKLSAMINAERELEMIKAMVLGRREEISSEMEYVYQSTGTAHVLAVSGLHVGIVFLLISRIFRLLKKTNLRWAYYALVVLAIWSYAFVTGSSPSVLRASLMLSVIIFAEAYKRRSNIYNSIFVSAFALLIYDPNLLFSVSFQLSYAAVLGIVYLYGRIYTLLYLKNTIANFFWRITALSLSVQITTFPITIYYFHQFPTIFLITNLIAIPTAALVIVASMILLISSWLPPISAGVAYLLEHWVYFYNQCLRFLSQWEFTNVDDLFIKGYQAVLLIVLTLMLTRFLMSKQLVFMRYFSYTLLLLAAVTFFDFQSTSRQQQIVFYDVGYQSYIDVFVGSHCYSTINSYMEHDQDVVFNVLPNRKYNRIEAVHPLREYSLARFIGKNSLLKFGDKTFLLLNDPGNISLGMKHDKIDYLVINRASLKNLDMAADLFKCSQLIIDGTIDSVTASRIDKVFEGCLELHSVARDGAIVISI